MKDFLNFLLATAVPVIATATRPVVEQGGRDAAKKVAEMVASSETTLDNTAIDELVIPAAEAFLAELKAQRAAQP